VNTRSTQKVIVQGPILPADDTRSIYHYLGILRNRRWFLTGVVSACLVLAFIATFLLPQEYRATSTVQIEPERADFYDNWRHTGTYAEYKSHYLTQLETLTSNGLARRVIQDLDLWQHAEFTPLWKRAFGVFENENAVIESFIARIGVSAVQGSMLLSVQFAASDAQLSRRILNGLMWRFTSEHGESKRELTVRAADWMSEKIPLLDSSLADAEKRIREFRREHDLLDINGNVSTLSEMDLSQASLELEQTHWQLDEAKIIFEDMLNPTDAGTRLESLEMVRNDPLVQEAWLRKSGALNHRETLSIKYGEKHPYMIDANSRLASLEAEIAGHIDRIMTTATNRVESLERRLAESQVQLEANRQVAMLEQEKRVQLSALEREVEIQRKLAEQFYIDTVSARSLAGFDVASAVVVDAAITPLEPYRPQRIIVLLLVALSSGVFCVLFVFVHEHFDDKIRNTRDVNDKLDMNLLGVMPDFSSTGLEVEEGKSRAPAQMYQHSDVVAEAVNNVRTALMTHASSRDSEGSLILVSASRVDEGCTTAAIALAHSFARLDSALLIDCHLREPGLSNVDSDLDNTIGLNTLVSGTTTIEDSIQANAFGGKFDALLCSQDIDRSTAILSSSQFAQTIAQLRKKYRWIILDSAPAERDSSALVLGRLADATVYVIKSHSTRLKAIQRGVSCLRSANGYVAGVLINRVDPNKMVARGGDYDYASYCGDISYKERNAWDVVRELSYSGASHAWAAYQRFDAASTWNKVVLAASTATIISAKWARIALEFAKNIPSTEFGQAMIGIYGSAKFVGIRTLDKSAQLWARADFSQWLQRCEPIRRAMISTTTHIRVKACAYAGDRVSPLSGKAAEGFAKLKTAFARHAEQRRNLRSLNDGCVDENR